MKQADLEALKQRLLTQLEALEEVAESGRQAGDVVELDQTRQGRLSRMDALQQQAIAKASESRRVQELRRIEAALGRMNRGEYGDCLDCGEPIAVKRLQADPATMFCIDCAK